jgi:hypothetical protein
MLRVPHRKRNSHKDRKKYAKGFASEKAGQFSPEGVSAVFTIVERGSSFSNRGTIADYKQIRHLVGQKGISMIKNEKEMDRILSVDTTKFPKGRLANRISLLSGMLAENFKQPKNYTGTEREIFVSFRSLDFEHRTLVIQTLREKLDNL